ncbi:DUF4846 domain-containing protein [Thermovenabulum sp.]|uniref:DUF4846 domain-containing protein n=1 Tax=Thermovenabulum sp. TaxID=3100335 RepID=UPI003C7C6086
MQKRRIILIIMLTVLLLTACEKMINEEKNFIKNQEIPFERKTNNLINEEGKTIKERIEVPEGFERIKLPEDSFGEYLRNLPLKPHGSKVRYYNGFVKPRDVHAAVIDMDVGQRDLMQCADSVIRLRAEYLYKRGYYDKIHFNFTNGFRADYKKWREGYRIRVEGNNTSWVKQAGYNGDYATFRKYLDMVFAYAGTLSLSKEMKRVSLEDLSIGDVFLEGGSPGHCVIVVDMAVNKNTGEKIFLLAQGYMPAQEIHVLKNPGNNDGNPWYSINFKEKLITPDYVFTKDQLYRFEE